MMIFMICVFVCMFCCYRAAAAAGRADLGLLLLQNKANSKLNDVHGWPALVHLVANITFTSLSLSRHSYSTHIVTTNFTSWFLKWIRDKHCSTPLRLITASRGVPRSRRVPGDGDSVTEVQHAICDMFTSIDFMAVAKWFVCLFVCLFVYYPRFEAKGYVYMVKLPPGAWDSQIWVGVKSQYASERNLIEERERKLEERMKRLNTALAAAAAAAAASNADAKNETVATISSKKDVVKLLNSNTSESYYDKNGIWRSSNKSKFSLAAQNNIWAL